MSLSATIAGILAADTTLMSTLTGGAHDAVEMSRQLTPGAFDANGEIKPCVLVKTGVENARENKISAVSTPVTIYFYQRAGYTAIDTALARVLGLLNLHHENGIWQVQFNNEIARTTDEALACSLAVQRYDVIRKR